MKKCLTSLSVAFAASAFMSTAYAGVEFYTGESRITEPDGDVTFDDAPYLMFYPLYEEDGLGLYLEDDIWHHYAPVNISTSPVYYPNGGHADLVVITKLDGSNIGAIEAQVSNGWSNATTTFVWMRAYLDGNLVGEGDIDAVTGEIVGAVGEFDELHIGSYFDAATRDMHDPTQTNAIAMDNIVYGGGSGGPSLSMSGSCPGSMTASVTGATPGGNVAFIYAFGTGNVNIPTGPCAGTELGLNGTATLLGTATADGSGNASLSGNAPASACGNVFLQSLDVSTCSTSNVEAI